MEDISEESLPIKLPREFTGNGFEIIGDPAMVTDGATLFFSGGDYAGMALPSREILPNWTPETAESWSKEWKRQEVERIAVELLENPEDHLLKTQLESYTRGTGTLKRFLKRAAADILKKPKTDEKGHPMEMDEKGHIYHTPSTWPAQNLVQQAVLIAISKAALELRRPPNMMEVISRMRAEVRLIEGETQKLTIGDDRDLAKAVRSMGFSWIESRQVGRPKST